MKTHTPTRPVGILAIEDNPRDLFFIEEALKSNKLDYRLQVIQDGEEAYSFVRRAGRQDGNGKLDLILLDLNMPRRDGIEILKKIRENHSLNDVPVAVLTSSAWPDDQINTSRYGADAFIRKPSSLAEFTKIGGALKALLGERTTKS